MAIAKITCTCTTCGKSFEHRKECYSRHDADRYQTWAEHNVTTCPDCRRRQQAAKQDDALTATLTACGIVLPQLTGASEKQIAYAESTRARYLRNSIDSIKLWHNMQLMLSDEAGMADYARRCEQAGTTVEAALKAYVNAAGLTTVEKMLTATTARQILDA